MNNKKKYFSLTVAAVLMGCSSYIKSSEETRDNTIIKYIYEEKLELEQNINKRIKTINKKINSLNNPSKNSNDLYDSLSYYKKGIIYIIKVINTLVKKSEKTINNDDLPMIANPAKFLAYTKDKPKYEHIKSDYIYDKESKKLTVKIDLSNKSKQFFNELEKLYKVQQ